MRIRPALALDMYKVGHVFQYPVGTNLIYSNMTARSAKHFNRAVGFDDKIVFFGLQGFIKWFLIDMWNTEFFNRPKDEVIGEYRKLVDDALGFGAVSLDHIEALHDIGFLPIQIKALPEGARINIKVPCLTIVNTIAEFYWLTNYLETVISSELWKACTSATTAHEYKRLLTKYAERTGSPQEFVSWQGHDFSMRGLSGIFDAASSGAAHLLSFLGTDTIPAINYLEDYYFASNDFVGGSVPATEHSVMCMGEEKSEIETFRRLITEVYPGGIVSIVSDTWDFWKVITEYSVTLKDEILNRIPNELGLSKVVFRPDSGDPVLILTGYLPNEYYVTDGIAYDYVAHEPISEAELKGAVECLWDVFGGNETDKGYKILDPHVGLIYGDSITLEKASQILNRLAKKGFASSNVVFGIGSYTYQHVTRDNLGFAIKSTYGEVNGVGRELVKDPKTDSGVKRSAKGLLRVEKEGNDYVLYDQQTIEQEKLGELKVVFRNGEAKNLQSLADIRSELAIS